MAPPLSVPLVWSLTALATIGVFVVEWMTPVGVITGVGYFVPLSLAYFLPRPKPFFRFAFLFSSLVAIGYYVSPEGGLPWVAVINRVLLSATFFAAAWGLRRRDRIDERVECRIAQQTEIAELGRIALTDLTVEDLMHRACGVIARIFSSRYVKVLEYVPSERRTRMIAGTGWSPGVVGRWSEPAEGDTMSAFSLREAKPVIVGRLSTERRFRAPQLLFDHHVQSCLNVPIPGESLQYGLLEADTVEVDRFDADDVAFFQTVAHLIGDAIRRHALVGALRKQREELQSANARLEAQAAELAEANRGLEEFALIASHDLQEPLRKIQTFGERLASAVPEGDPATYARKIGEAARRMKSLMDDLLLFARLKKSGTHKVDPVKLDAVLEDVVIDLELRISEQKAAIERAPLGTVKGDYFQLHQLFLNLLANSLKYRKPDEPPRVVVERRDADGRGFEIRVRDNGIGFDVKYADQIFQPFRRLHGKGTVEGTGLGLSICRRIMEYHGGTIRAESEPGRGSTFVLTFPPSES